VRLRRVLALLVLAALVALVPLAHASPPDPSWIGGFYDDADYDDVVLLATSTVGVVGPDQLDLGSPARLVVGPVPIPIPPRLGAAGLPANLTRAPPGV
jgi:hypothetical protein